MRYVPSTDIEIEADGVSLVGTLAVPPRAIGLVVFAHGSGSSRFSPRNRHIAAALHDHGLATLLVDLLTGEEGRVEALDTTLRPDVDVLAERLLEVTDWLAAHPRLSALPLCYVGSGTGAGAALRAAARRPDLVACIVSRSGRSELAGPVLAGVRAPTLFVVGSEDRGVLELNRASAHKLGGPWRISVVPGASHLFEEPGALDAAARLAADWLHEHLPDAPGRSPAAPLAG